ncbi:MAG: AAA family ATPase [Methylococcaceae bacterium]|nr:AAA family ATPase [Methylococcaceae bacterium]
MSHSLKLPPEALKLTVNLADYPWPPTPSLQEQAILGQKRAQSALAFGVAMPTPGYNIYVKGDSGTGRLTMINQLLDNHAKAQETPWSYAYVENFDNAREPLALALPAGQGQAFSKAIEKLLDSLLATFPAVFENPTYQQKKGVIERDFNQLYNNAIELVDVKATAYAIALFRDNESISFAPIRDDKALEEDQFILLPPTEREIFHKQVQELEAYLSEVLLELPQWRRNSVEKIRELDNDTINVAIAPLFDELHDHYADIDDVISYLSAIRENIGTTIMAYLQPGRSLEIRDNTTKRLLLTEQYLPNILVDHKDEIGAPVVYEVHPTYQNLFGRIEYSSEQGTLITNYRRICAGSLHKANGGYLIIDAEKLLNYPLVWEGLKRALKSGRIEIESPYSELGVNTITLKPEVIPLNIKVILLGSEEIYYLLQDLDSEFNEMFHILADFDHDIRLDKLSMQQFANLMVNRAHDLGIAALTRCAVERLIEHSCRLSESQYHLSARINDSLEIIGESNLLCKQAQIAQIDKAAIETALAARDERNGRISENILEEMLDGTILIDTDGEAVGKVNGLTVLEIGNSIFGAPARITTTVYPGSRGIVDIEREAELGQSIHSKGVLILTGYLGHCYAQQFPLAISASIAIEQSYGFVDGDSASLAELCCLISALTRVPVKQAIAVTGSINQYGEVQAIGGVNEKIEGFFRLCQARGLNGKHAVIIPTANKRNLMLKQEVIDAVAAGLFAVYCVASVDETLSLLTDLEAGVMQADGSYPLDTLNYKAICRLKEIADITQDADKDDTETG